jgi:hypothetical protein
VMGKGNVGDEIQKVTGQFDKGLKAERRVQTAERRSRNTNTSNNTYRQWAYFQTGVCACQTPNPKKEVKAPRRGFPVKADLFLSTSFGLFSLYHLPALTFASTTPSLVVDMSDSQHAQDSNMSDVQSDDIRPGPANMPDQQQEGSKPLSLGYSIEGLAKPGQFDDEPAFPGINLNENIERGFKNLFMDMLDHFEKAQSEAAEVLAHELLSWGRLPVLYRVYSHVVSTLTTISTIASS